MHAVPLATKEHDANLIHAPLGEMASEKKNRELAVVGDNLKKIRPMGPKITVVWLNVPPAMFVPSLCKGLIREMRDITFQRELLQPYTPSMRFKLSEVTFHLVQQALLVLEQALTCRHSGTSGRYRHGHGHCTAIQDNALSQLPSTARSIPRKLGRHYRL